MKIAMNRCKQGIRQTATGSTILVPYEIKLMEMKKINLVMVE